MAKTRYEGGTATLSVENVLSIRKRLRDSELGVEAFGQATPTRPDLLDSAVSRQFTSFDGRLKYERPVEVAATLFYGIAKNHAFDNGNKRTGLVACLVSLDQNKRSLVNTSQDDLYEMATSIAAGTFALKGRQANRSADTEVLALSSWLRQRTQGQGVGDKSLDFKELEPVLKAQGCTFDAPNDNYIKIRSGALSVRTGYPGHNFRVGVQEIKRIRKGLHLDVINTDEFYDIDNTVDEFVLRYRDVLRRLADA